MNPALPVLFSLARDCAHILSFVCNHLVCSAQTEPTQPSTLIRFSQVSVGLTYLFFLFLFFLIYTVEHPQPKYHSFNMWWSIHCDSSIGRSCHHINLPLPLPFITFLFWWPGSYILLAGVLTGFGLAVAGTRIAYFCAESGCSAHWESLWCSPICSPGVSYSWIFVSSV